MVGLGSSLVMLMIVAALATGGNTRGSHVPPPEDFGPIHLVWIVIQNAIPDLRKRISGVEQPSSAHLRQAGLAELHCESSALLQQ